MLEVDSDILPAVYRLFFLVLTPRSCHSDLNDQNLFHSTIDTAPGMPGVLKNEDNHTEVHTGESER